MRLVSRIAVVCLAVLSLLGFTSAVLAEETESASYHFSTATLPEQYSIAYEREISPGMTETVQKTVDALGNVYFKSGVIEMLFIKQESRYTLYTRNYGNQFVAYNNTPVYTADYIASVTAEFTAYAECSHKRMISGMKELESQQMLGRECNVYGVDLGLEQMGLRYTLVVDKGTGICLAWNEIPTLSGEEVESVVRGYKCVEFLTDNIPSLEDMLWN